MWLELHRGRIATRQTSCAGRSSIKNALGAESMFSSVEIFGLAIQIEENGELFYRRALTAVDDPTAKEMLGWLADEETRHREFFLAMRASAVAGRGEAWFDQLNGTILQSFVGDHAFSLDEIDFESLPDERALLEIAVELERDSIAFYDILRSFVTDPEILQQIEQISHEEHRHLEVLRGRQVVMEDCLGVEPR
jgi:rubrerythrin